MLNKKKFMNEVAEVISKGKSNIDALEFELLFNTAVGAVGNTDNIANTILEKLFLVPVMKDLLIPLSFFETEIGKAILQVKFGIEKDEIYLVDEVAAMVGVSTQYMYREAKNGNIKGEQRNKTWLFRAKDVEEYLLKKGKKVKKVTYEEKKEDIKLLGFENESTYE